MTTRAVLTVSALARRAAAADVLGRQQEVIQRCFTLDTLDAVRESVRAEAGARRAAGRFTPDLHLIYT